MFFVSELEAVTTTSVFQRGGSIDEEDGVFNVVFLAEFSKERVGENVCSGRLKLCME